MKKVLSIFMVISIMLSVFSFGFVTNAIENENTDNTIIPRWTSISKYTAGMDISGLTAYVSASLSPGYETNLEIVAQLQKETSTGYETVKTWTVTKASGHYISLDESKLINPLNDYRVRFTFTADQESIVVFKYP